jgi:hypothetical protein
MKIRGVAKWYDFWVGLFWDGKKRRLYVLPLPMLGFYLEFKQTVRSCQRNPPTPKRAETRDEMVMIWMVGTLEGMRADGDAEGGLASLNAAGREDFVLLQELGWKPHLSELRGCALAVNGDTQNTHNIISTLQALHGLTDPASSQS